MRLSREQKNIELQKYLTLVHATFDYLILRFGRQYVFDDVATNEVMYKKQQVRAKNHFDEGRLDKLKKMLKTETEWLGIMSDVAFEKYIKNSTGYTIDLFAEIRKSADKVLKKGKIENETESRHIRLMISLYEKTIGNEEKLKALQSLQTEFYQRNRETHDVLGVDNQNHEEVFHHIERIEKEDTVEIHGSVSIIEWDGPKPKHYKEQEKFAPDRKHSLMLTECTSGKYSSTTVSVNFTDTRIEFYHAEGIHPNINAYWKDNVTIIVETEKHYHTLAKYRKLENYGDRVAVEYIET